MKKFSVGMLGFGYWGKILYRYFKKHTGFEVKKIATRHPERLKDEVRDDVEICLPDELFEDESLDAIIIATPIVTHYDYIMKALEKGKHVFSEKPMTLSSNEADDIDELAKKRGLTVFTDYIFTFSPAVLKMISLVKEGAVGKVSSAVFHVRQLGHFSENNVIIDLGCHILSVMDMLTPVDGLKMSRLDLLSHDGIVETAIIDFESPEALKSDDRGEYMGDLKGGIFLSFNHPIKVRNMTIYGEKGTLVYDMMQEKPLQLLNYTLNRSVSRDPVEKEVIYYDFDEFNTVEKVVEGFHGILTGRQPSNLEMSIRVTKTLARILKI